MTPLAFTRDLAADLATRGTPAPHNAQLGDIVVACAGTYVTAVNEIEVDLGGNCAPITLVDLIVILARDCANVANEDGSTNWAAQDAVSALMDLDGTLLWEWAGKLRAESWYRTGTPTITYMVLGGIAMTTLGLQLPLP